MLDHRRRAGASRRRCRPTSAPGSPRRRSCFASASRRTTRRLMDPAHASCPIRLQAIPQRARGRHPRRGAARSARRGHPQPGAVDRPQVSRPRAVPGRRSLRRSTAATATGAASSAATSRRPPPTSRPASTTSRRTPRDPRRAALRRRSAAAVDAPARRICSAGCARSRTSRRSASARACRSCARCAIDDELSRALRKHHPLFVNTHFNHAKELTPEARAACERLVDAGIPVGNQTVLLRGVNSSVRSLRALMRGAAARARAAVLPVPGRHRDRHRSPAHAGRDRAGAVPRACAAG